MYKSFPSLINESKHRLLWFVFLFFSSFSSVSFSDDFGSIVYRGCINPKGSDRLFVEGYVRGYTNAFRYQLRDLEFRTDKIPSIDRICGFYKDKYDPQEHKGTLAFNVIIEHDVLLSNGYQYKDFDQARSKVYGK